ncbi:MAG: hypothetical protein WC330_06815, partial [Candidatus Omnitrophota bacterium]
ALNTGSGDIDIINTGDLIIGAVGSTTGITNNGGDIKIAALSNLNINADIAANGGDILLSASGDVNITDSIIISSAGDMAFANIFGEDINITNSSIQANAKNDLALVSLVASNDITLDALSQIRAVSGDGFSVVLGLAANNLITDASISASSTDGVALVALLAGNNLTANGPVRATSENSFAAAALLALGDIYAADVMAQGSSTFDLISILEGFLGIDIGSQYTYSSAVLIASLLGDVTLGDISADMVLVAAILGNIYDVGDVTAHYLGLLAAGDIGTAANPIRTNVDILSAYSWNEGDIYINEKDDIELGLYLPVYDSSANLIGALGMSVAANNGIIHIVSNGDMLVNSVISPLGGVYLESTNGSIYAGHGWNPAVSQANVNWLASEIDSILGGAFGIDAGDISWFIGEALMGLNGTPWKIIAGIDYFSPIMVSVGSDLPVGSNVIAGGYSYFSTPNGTIGVGTPGAPSVTNPLKVNIQVINGYINSALPSGTSPAGLVLRIGGGAGSYDAGNGNGTRPISGVIQGIVRPATTAITGVYPSPALDLASIPTGYVLYDDTDAASVMGTGTTAFTAPAAANAGLQQIWPAYPFSVPSGILEELLRRGLGYYEILSLIRITSSDNSTPFFFGYHPLTPTDYSAFDGINLDIGAYDFIEGNLNLKDKNKLYPYYEENEELKKKNQPVVL